jgi:hypothetical protein
VKAPALFVLIVRRVPCDALEITTFALGTAAPLGSLTTPEIPATPPDCAKRGAETINNTNSVAKHFTFIEKTSQKVSLQLKTLIEPKDPNPTVCENRFACYSTSIQQFCNNPIYFQILFTC